MADDNFRPYRSRDPVKPRSAAAPARGQIDDPLAELARLIGQSDPQSDPTNDYGRDARRGSAAALDEPAGGLDWAADDRYAELSEPAQDGYAVSSDERYEPTRVGDPYPSNRPGPFSHDGEYEAQDTGQFSAPAPRFDGPRESAPSYGTAEQPPYRDEQEPADSGGRQLPAFLPRSRAESYADDDQARGGSDDQAYAQEDYEEEAPDGRRRGGFVVIAAVLGLAVLGTAGAFAYRAMFGGSMLPSLPPIIRADNGPNKIVPNANNFKGSTSDQAGADTAISDDKLVSREEQPVTMPAPVNSATRVVSTIPIFPDPNSAQAGLAASGAPGNAAAIAPTPVPPAARTQAPPGAASVATSAPFPAVAATPPSSPAASPEPKKIHTVPIRPDQVASAAEAAPALPPAARNASVQSPAPRLLKPAAAPAPKAEANAPLSIVPEQGDAQASAPARTRIALAQPTPLSPAARSETAPPAGGSYAVQVTSQRSEAEAQTAFRALRAKFPNQLGSHEPIIRRADLGDKGVFYRAMVGPYASMEQAAGMCSNLKAAGGICIVQRN